MSERGDGVAGDVQVLREALCPNWGVQPHGGCEYCARNEDAQNAVSSLAARCEELEREREEARVRELERVHKAEDERDDYRFWNERVRVCEHHTQDVAAPVGDCLVCNAEAAESLLEEAKQLLLRPTKRGADWHDAVDDFLAKLEADERGD